MQFFAPKVKASPSSSVKAQVSLPTYWVVSKAVSNILQPSEDGLTIHASQQSTRMTVLANRPFPVQHHNVVCYFEITIVELPPDSIVAIGLAESTFPSSKQQPGWLEKSYGYHSDDGKFFNVSQPEERAAYGPTWKKGDVVGCGINSKRDVYFTLNGFSLGIAYEAAPQQEFCPILGFKGPSVVSTNFGRSPYVFDITCRFAQIRQNKATRYKPGQRVHITDLPKELLLEILAYVNEPRTIVGMGGLRKDWVSLLQDNALWRYLFLEKWPHQKADLNIQSWFKFYKSRIEHATKYGPDSHPIENCEFQFKCPLLWEDLVPAIEDGSRFCDKCVRHVKWVSSQEELDEAARQGQCVAFGAPQLLEPKQVWMGEPAPRTFRFPWGS